MLRYSRNSPAFGLLPLPNTLISPHPMWIANARRRWTSTRFPLMTWLVLMARPLRASLSSTLRRRLTRRGANTLASWAMSCAISERSSSSDAGSTPAAEASAGPASGAPRLCRDVVGLHGRSTGRRKGAPDGGPPRRGLPTRQAEFVVEFRGTSAQGSILPRRILWASFYPTRIFSYLVRLGASPSSASTRQAPMHGRDVI
jgi:hypothetical protein